METYYSYLSLAYGLTGDDLNGDGKADTYTLCDKKLAVIQQLPLQPGQKTALAIFAAELKEGTVRQRAPWLR